MLGPVDALPLAVERAGEPPWRQAVARSVQERCDLSEFDKCEIGREAGQPYNYRGTVIRLDDSEKKLLMRWKVAVGAVYGTLAIALVVVIVMQAYLRNGEIANTANAINSITTSLTPHLDHPEAVPR